MNRLKHYLQAFPTRVQDGQLHWAELTAYFVVLVPGLLAWVGAWLSGRYIASAVEKGIDTQAIWVAVRSNTNVVTAAYLALLTYLVLKKVRSTESAAVRWSITALLGFVWGYFVLA